MSNINRPKDPRTAKLNPILNNLSKSISGEQKRPDHPDFMTSSELKVAEFTGIRQNQMAQQWEFWLVGEMSMAVSFQAAKDDPYALTKAHIEVFKLKPVKGVMLVE